MTESWLEDEAHGGQPYPSYARLLQVSGTPAAESWYSWTVTTLQAAEYVATAFAPTTVDFDSLSQELEVHRSLYESTIGPIRNNVAAHSGPITEEEMRDLFANVQMVDFDRLVVFRWS